MALSEKATVKMRISEIKDRMAQVNLHKGELESTLKNLKSLDHFTDEDPTKKTKRLAYIADYVGQIAALKAEFTDLETELKTRRQRLIELNGNRHLPY